MTQDDLSEFRKKWVNELKQKSAGKQNASAESESNGSSSLDLQPPKDPQEQAGTSGRPHSNRPPPLWQHELEEDADEPLEDPLQVFDHQAESSATYYPFRILTTLLNHATSEAGPESVRRVGRSRKAETKSASVTPKRAYFSVDDDGGDKERVLKKVKGKDSTQEKTDEQSDKKDYLDLFIADLNEIGEIPFFDISLPREVAIKIFWYLDVVDLCHCAQVSKSWRSLAEDELLWCRICHRLGFEKDTLTVEHSNWKSRVRHYSIVKQTLELNWKGRTGRLHNLHHAKGGVLCAAHSHKSTIVAGYSNCQTKLWDVMSGETCIFQPSSTALLIDESEEEGTISNEVLHVATCDKVTAASYSHGFVDVWSNEEGTEPFYTFTCEGGVSSRQPTSLQLWEDQRNVYLAVSNNHHVQVHSVCDGEGCLKEAVVFDGVVKASKWLQPKDRSSLSTLTPTLAVATKSTVSVMALYEREVGTSYDLLELHNIVDAPVMCIDARLDPAEVVVGFTLCTGPAQYFKVTVYDIMTRQVSAALTGHTSFVQCVNMADSPDHQLVTGSTDRKVRVYDRRITRSAIMTLMGHSAAVTTVQMDDVKVVSGDEAGFVCVWDQRMASKLWEMNNRHPVRYCHFDERALVIGHVPYIKQYNNMYDFDTGLHQRHRGSLHMYDFLADQTRQGVPEICLSSYDEPQGYNYNIALAMPYDQV